VNHQVGIADMRVTDQHGDVLITYSLGSCVGLTVYDPEACVGGLLHAMLPLSRNDQAKAKEKPSMFTDTGIQVMLTEMFRLGARKSNLIVKVAGGATMLDSKEFFRIGERNVAVVRKMLWKNGILIKAMETGGNISRTMTLHMDTGVTTIRTNGQTHEL